MRSRALPTSAFLLSGATALGAVGASVVTLVWDGAFPEASPPAAFNSALAEARGWAAVTLTGVLPLHAVAIVLAWRGSVRGELALVGTLAYFVYTYLELAVSPPFSALYLAYVATFACAIPALVLGIGAIDSVRLSAAVGERIHRRTLSAFALVPAALLSLAWLKDILARTLGGDFGWPAGEAAIAHVVHALDLGLQVPLAVATAALLLRRRPGGLVAAAVLLVNSLCMGTALVAMVAADAIASHRGLVSAAPFAVLPLVAVALALPFFRSVPRSIPSEDARSPA